MRVRNMCSLVMSLFSRDYIKMCSDLTLNCVYLPSIFYPYSINVFNLVLVLYRISIFYVFKLTSCVCIIQAVIVN